MQSSVSSGDRSVSQKENKGKQILFSNLYKVLSSFRYAVMSECWLEKPEDRPAFSWICTAIKRLINDHKVHKKAQKNQCKADIEGGCLMSFNVKRENKEMWGDSF